MNWKNLSKAGCSGCAKTALATIKIVRSTKFQTTAVRSTRHDQYSCSWNQWRNLLLCSVSQKLLKDVLKNFLATDSGKRCKLWNPAQIAWGVAQPILGLDIYCLAKLTWKVECKYLSNILSLFFNYLICEKIYFSFFKNAALKIHYIN